MFVRLFVGLFVSLFVCLFALMLDMFLLCMRKYVVSVCARCVLAFFDVFVS